MATIRLNTLVRKSVKEIFQETGWVFSPSWEIECGFDGFAWCPDHTVAADDWLGENYAEDDSFG